MEGVRMYQGLLYISMDLAMYMYFLWSFNDIPDVIHYIIFPTNLPYSQQYMPWIQALMWVFTVPF